MYLFHPRMLDPPPFHHKKSNIQHTVEWFFNIYAHTQTQHRPAAVAAKSKTNRPTNQCISAASKNEKSKSKGEAAGRSIQKPRVCENVCFSGCMRVLMHSPEALSSDDYFYHTLVLQHMSWKTNQNYIPSMFVSPALMVVAQKKMYKIRTVEQLFCKINVTFLSHCGFRPHHRPREWCKCTWSGIFVLGSVEINFGSGISCQMQLLVVLPVVVIFNNPTIATNHKNNQYDGEKLYF